MCVLRPAVAALHGVSVCFGVLLAQFLEVRSDEFIELWPSAIRGVCVA